MTHIAEAIAGGGTGEVGGIKPAKAVDKALQVLDVYLSMGHSMGISEIARHVDLPKSTAYRIIRQLAASGYLIRAGDSYRLSYRLFHLGTQFIHARPNGLLDVASPYLGTLLMQTGYCVQVGVLEGPEVTILERLQTHRMNVSFGPVASTQPPTTSSIGKIILAMSEPETINRVYAAGLRRATPSSIQLPAILNQQLATARSTGVAYDLEETTVGVVSVAAAVHWQGRPIAGIAVAGPAGRFDPKTASALVNRTANAVEAQFMQKRILMQDFRS